MNMLMMMLRMMLRFASFRRLQARKEGRMSHTTCMMCCLLVCGLDEAEARKETKSARQRHDRFAASHIIIGILYASLSV
jgi:hypothetical protein